SHLETKYGIPPGAHGHHEEHDDEHDEEHDEEHGEEEEGEEFIRLDMEQTRYDAMLHLHNPTDWIEVLRGFVTYTDYEHRELEGSETGTEFERDTWETRIELVHDAIFGVHGVVGLQTRLDEFEAVGEEAYIPKTESTEIGLFLLEDFHSGDWTYEAGLRLDYVERDPDAMNADEDDFTTFSLSGAALWNFDPAWTAGAALSYSSRAPSTEELYSNADADDEESLVTHAATGLIEVGDPDLDEETSFNVDLSLQWRAERSWAEVAVFYNQFTDYIFLFNSGEEVDETPVYLYEQDDAEFYGVEFQSEFHLFDLGQGKVALGVFGDMITGEFDDEGDVPRLPPARIGGELKWVNDTASVWVRGLNADDQDDPGDFETETDGYTRWDLGADYTFRFGGDSELLVFGKWKNISDEEIRLSTSFLRNYAPEAGESFEVGMRYSF
ncbi:MAG: TonB-dependent receptor, partial [Halioglobus sp.]